MHKIYASRTSSEQTRSPTPGSGTTPLVVLWNVYFSNVKCNAAMFVSSASMQGILLQDLLEMYFFWNSYHQKNPKHYVEDSGGAAAGS